MSPKSSESGACMQNSSATSNIPARPSVELIRKRERKIPLCEIFPCRSEFAKLRGKARLLKKLLIPRSAGSGTM